VRWICSRTDPGGHPRPSPRRARNQGAEVGPQSRTSAGQAGGVVTVEQGKDGDRCRSDPGDEPPRGDGARRDGGQSSARGGGPAHQQDWSRPTDCTGWDVNALPMCWEPWKSNASTRDFVRHHGSEAKRRADDRRDDRLPGPGRATMSPEEVAHRLRELAPKAIRGRRRTPSCCGRCRSSPDRQLRAPGRSATSSGPQ
jgi:hypothetical protein